MKRSLLVILMLLVSLPAVAKSKFIYNNGRFNYVKIETMDKSELKTRQPTQPFTISEEKMKQILQNINISRSFILKKEVETQEVFDERAVNFLAAKLVDAFAQATDKDKVVISYLTKDPIFVLRNDRLTIATMWVQGTDLYITFDKLAAKMIGDYDKRGDHTKMVANAKGLRMSIEVGEGQSYGSDTDVLVIDTTFDYSKIVKAEEPLSPQAEAKKAKKEAQEKARVEAKAKEDAEYKVIREPSDDPKGAQLVKKEKIKNPEPVKTEATAGITQAEPPKTTKARLKELDQLKDDGLITDKEYKQKRKEILEGL